MLSAKKPKIRSDNVEFDNVFSGASVGVVEAVLFARSFSSSEFRSNIFLSKVSRSAFQAGGSELASVSVSDLAVDFPAVKKETFSGRGGEIRGEAESSWAGDKPVFDFLAGCEAWKASSCSLGLLATLLAS